MAQQHSPVDTTTSHARPPLPSTPPEQSPSTTLIHESNVTRTTCSRPDSVQTSLSWSGWVDSDLDRLDSTSRPLAPTSSTVVLQYPGTLRLAAWQGVGAMDDHRVWWTTPLTAHRGARLDPTLKREVEALGGWQVRWRASHPTSLFPIIIITPHGAV